MATTKPSKAKLIQWGIIALIGSALGACGDVLLLYNPDVSYLTGDYSFMVDISPVRLVCGSFLGVLFIPLVLFGLWQVYQLIYERHPGIAKLGFGIAIYFCCIGVVVHAMFGAMGLAIKQENFLYLNYLRLLLDTFSGLSVLLHVLVSAIFSMAIFRKPSSLPIWMVYCNPVSIYIALASTYLFFPPLGSILAPAAFNLSYFVYFGCSTWVIYRQNEA